LRSSSITSVQFLRMRHGKNVVAWGPWRPQNHECYYFSHANI